MITCAYTVHKKKRVCVREREIWGALITLLQANPEMDHDLLKLVIHSDSYRSLTKATPSGLTLSRQTYPYKKIRGYCSKDRCHRIFGIPGYFAPPFQIS